LKDEASKNMQTVSVIVCSKDRHDSLLRILHSLDRYSREEKLLEFIIVEETDNPQQPPGEKIRYFQIPERGLGFAFARNFGLQKANGSIVVFIDDDIFPALSWLDELLAPFQDDSVVGVQGGVTVPESSNGIGWAESILGFPGGGISKVLQAKGKNQLTKEISTLNCAYRKWVIEKVGGFDENLTLGSEDYLLAKLACLYGQCLFAPNALVHHEARGTLKKIWHWFVRRGRAEMRLVKLRKIEETNLGSIPRSSITCKFLLLVLAGVLFPGFFTPLLVMAFVVYSILQLARFFRPWKLSNAPVSTIFLVPLVKLVMDSAMDWGRIRGLLLD
jgi:GT2 family glycosyltransferase